MKLTNEDIEKLKTDLKENLNKFFQVYYEEKTLPVDIFSILKRLNFEVYYGKLPNRYDGWILVDENVSVIDGFGSNKIMTVNSKLSYRASIFTLAHELAHYLTQKWLKGDKEQRLQFELREHTLKGERAITENFMDYIAACILMPEEEFKKDLEANGVKSVDDISSGIIEKLKTKYDTEYEAVRRRIYEILS